MRNGIVLCADVAYHHYSFNSTLWHTFGFSASGTSRGPEFWAGLGSTSPASSPLWSWGGSHPPTLVLRLPCQSKDSLASALPDLQLSNMVVLTFFPEFATASEPNLKLRYKTKKAGERRKNPLTRKESAPPSLKRRPAEAIGKSLVGVVLLWGIHCHEDAPGFQGFPGSED